MANKVLVVVDMQNDFIDGSLSNAAAQAIVPKIARYVAKFDGLIVFTRDTHETNYLETKEGKHLPIPHCIAQTDGWQINETIFKAAKSNKKARLITLNKPTFSAGASLYTAIHSVYAKDIEAIEICGTCTDICVVSNALSLVSGFKDTEIIVHESMCAGLTAEKHNAALEVMRSCQIEVVK